MACVDGREPLTFEEAIEAETKNACRMDTAFDYFYIDRGFTPDRVEAYQRAFKSVKIVLLEDLKLRPAEMLAEICQFLGVDESFIFQREDGLNVHMNRVSNL